MSTTGQTRSSGVTADTVLVNAAETIIAQVQGLNAPQGSAVSLVASALITPGATVTAVTLTLRKGLLVTSPVVGEPVTFAATTAANNPANALGQWVDLLAAELAGGAYTLTAIQVGGSTNGAATQASLSATWS